MAKLLLSFILLSIFYICGKAEPYVGIFGGADVARLKYYSMENSRNKFLSPGFLVGGRHFFTNNLIMGVESRVLLGGTSNINWRSDFHNFKSSIGKNASLKQEKDIAISYKRNFSIAGVIYTGYMVEDHIVKIGLGVEKAHWQRKFFSLDKEETPISINSLKKAFQDTQRPMHMTLEFGYEKIIDDSTSVRFNYVYAFKDKVHSLHDYQKKHSWSHTRYSVNLIYSF